MFFGFYDLTQEAWISILLVGLAQTIIFLPFRFIGAILNPDLKEFETELEKTKTDNQYLIFHEKVRQGNSSVVFYILNFVLLGLAFFSVGRVFLLDFYNEKINPVYLYHFIPYPEYPIKGTDFEFPFFHINSTFALNWHTIFTAWGMVLAVMVALRLLWIILKRFLSKNKSLLNIRISYNRLVLIGSGFAGTLFIVSTIFLRHIPNSIQFVFLSADLTKQNTVFNIITAICTCLATIHSGYTHNKEAVIVARNNKIPEAVINKVFKNNMSVSLRNGIFLALLTYWITHQMPSSHDLSVLSFEFLYLISPFTFDMLIPKKTKKITLPDLPYNVPVQQ